MKEVIIYIMMSLLANKAYTQNDINLNSMQHSAPSLSRWTSTLNIEAFHKTHTSPHLYSYFFLSNYGQHQATELRAQYFDNKKLDLEFTDTPGLKQKRTGKILTLSGAAVYAITLSIILHDPNRFRGQGWGASLPIIWLHGGSFYTMVGGITLWIIGGKQIQRHREMTRKANP